MNEYKENLIERLAEILNELQPSETNEIYCRAYNQCIEDVLASLQEI